MLCGEEAGRTPPDPVTGKEYPPCFDPYSDHLDDPFPEEFR